MRPTWRLVLWPVSAPASPVSEVARLTPVTCQSTHNIMQSRSCEIRKLEKSWHIVKFVLKLL